MNEGDREAYVNLIYDLMEATRDSEGNPEVVYPLLQENLDKLDRNFLTIWRELAEAVLSQADRAETEYIARDIIDFSNLISDFPLGSKRTNMEISMAGYDILLTVFTGEGHPENWAMTQKNLGNAYFYRISGDRAENLERAIASYKKALQVRTKETFPMDEINLDTML